MAAPAKGTVTGAIKMRKGDGYIQEQPFAADIDGSGDITLQWRNMEPGTCEVWLAGKTRKTGGYWYMGRRAEDNATEHIFGAIELNTITTFITVPEPKK
ncbi:hypothetical protein [Streptomyces sp. NPDC058401]|uniref:hypothetical protein n=1 Tax=Streptomyces sp. NPDC058401 TaxID=3346480 RepID=UPI0036580E7A